MLSEQIPDCELCSARGGTPLWRNALCRVVRVDDPDLPGFCRVILNRHVREMTDLPNAEQQEILVVVLAVEACLRQLLKPDKINLASLGNLTPHVHWHVIPRWRDDPFFPNPIWAATLRSRTALPIVVDDKQLQTELAERLGPSLSLTGEQSS